MKKARRNTMESWNPWHGCHRISPGCAHCYVYRRDDSVGRDASLVTRNDSFGLPLKKDRAGAYKLRPGTEVFTCGTSDFFVEEADEWRAEAWSMIRARSDVRFLIPTKRIHRMGGCLPPDWGAGYENVTIACTVENQRMADMRMPIFLDLPIRRRYVFSEPLLEDIDFADTLRGTDLLVAGGESGQGARTCDYDWVLSLRSQAQGAGIRFYFKQTGARFKKDGRIYAVPRRQQHAQAAKAGINIDFRWGD